MVTRDFNEPGGFGRYRPKPSDDFILLPLATIAALKEDEFLVEKAGAQIKPKKTVQPTVAAQGKGQRLPKLRLNTDQDITGAIAFSRKFLAGVPPPVRLPAKLSEELLTAVVMVNSYQEPQTGMAGVLHYLVDPGWSSAKQAVWNLINTKEAWLQKPAALWIGKLSQKLYKLFDDDERCTANVKAAHEHWSMALSQSPAERAAIKVQSAKANQNAIQVFDLDALTRADAVVNEMASERQAAGMRILGQARANEGRRTLPDPKQAIPNLEAKKLAFANLIEPIERLQNDLILSAAMKPQEFRMSPILLLGDPGIGKTYLATQLAAALGVTTHKISAGGAQGGFQFTGSHGGWQGAKPGMVIETLAQSTSACPVLVVDEVDKIHDTRYPVLPVLLDLLDAGSATQFRDEYLEMSFDASRIIFVLTANNIDNVPPPLLSRAEVFTIPSPDPDQRLRIIEQTVAGLCQKTNHQISLKAGTAQRLADRVDIDLRQLHRLVSVGFARAVQTGAKFATVEMPLGKNFVRFHLHAWSPTDPVLH